MIRTPISIYMSQFFAYASQKGREGVVFFFFLAWFCFFYFACSWGIFVYSFFPQISVG